MTFGTKTAGTFTLGRNIGLFGADVILNDMTLLGVGAPGAAAGASPANTTLGGIGFGYIYTDWLAQIDYTTPDLSGFAFTVGAFDPLNSLSDGTDVEPKKAPGFHAKLTYTLPIAEGTKLYVSVAAITQQQDYVAPNLTPPAATTTLQLHRRRRGFFAKLDLQDLELIGYYYHATGLGTTALFDLGDFGICRRAPRMAYLAQVTYKFGAVKLGANYGASNLDYANAADQAGNPDMVRSNRKGTLGVYYSLTKNLMLLAEAAARRASAAPGATMPRRSISARSLAFRRSSGATQCPPPVGNAPGGGTSAWPRGYERDGSAIVSFVTQVCGGLGACTVRLHDQPNGTRMLRLNY